MLDLCKWLVPFLLRGPDDKPAPTPSPDRPLIVRCGVCGALRHPRDIEVKTLPVEIDGVGIGVQNLPFCGDCANTAAMWPGYFNTGTTPTPLDRIH
jgi:hypothetical protein